ncbi:caspase family protein [Paraferrimonas sp. SM1919]|uniref:caspase family protein n=1 Tax=Paraferrimonas sp. SM1919 TaxID=2662263 RepID=UPI0013D15260|nr:caspase family protein [Paraferrimonas sp. SM1919]
MNKLIRKLGLVVSLGLTSHVALAKLPIDAQSALSKHDWFSAKTLLMNDAQLNDSLDHQLHIAYSALYDQDIATFTAYLEQLDGEDFSSEQVALFEHLQTAYLLQQAGIITDWSAPYILFKGVERDTKRYYSEKLALKAVKLQLDQYIQGETFQSFIEPIQPTLVRGEFEKTSDFKQRVLIEAGSYAKAQQFYERQLIDGKKNNLETKKQRFAFANFKQNYLIESELNNKLKAGSIRVGSYDADLEQYKLTLTHNLNGKIELEHAMVPIDIQEAKNNSKAIKQQLSQAKPIFIKKIKNGSLSFQSIALLDERTKQVWPVELTTASSSKALDSVTLPNLASISEEHKALTEAQSQALKITLIQTALADEVNKLRKELKGKATNDRQLQQEIRELQATPVEQFSDDLPSLLAKAPKAQTKENHFAVIVGIDEYQKVQEVMYAENSAKMFNLTIQKVLGVPKENIHLLTGKQATAYSIQARIQSILEDAPDNSRIYFYFAGHGIPNQKDGGSSFILPYEGEPGNIHHLSQMKVDNILTSLSQNPSIEVVSFLDSCFSGRADNQFIFNKGIAAALVRRMPLQTPVGKSIVFQAGTDTEFANYYPEKGHRLFSYFLIKGLLSGKTSTSSLIDFVKPRVRQKSKTLGDIYKQTPSVVGNTEELGEL